MIVTDDNPRTEDGDAIVADIVKGLAKPARALIERDRAKAIAQGIALGKAGDVVLIAGKGHEDYQIVGTERRHFSDREVVARPAGAAPMMAWRLSELVRCTPGQLVGNDCDFSSVSTDTRTLRPGALFVALSGPNFDGHDFVAAAAERGAAAALVERPLAVADSADRRRPIRSARCPHSRANGGASFTFR